MHMGDLLRLVHEHPEAEIAGLYDPDLAKMQSVAGTFGVPEDKLLYGFRCL